MLSFASDAGIATKEFILAFAAMLAGDAVPGGVALGLVVFAVGCGLWAGMAFTARTRAVRRLTAHVETLNDQPFANARDRITDWIAANRRGRARQTLAAAWDEFNETLFIEEIDGQSQVRNAVRPGFFFNLEDLHFGPGFFRILPGVFVSGGLALTFLGLIAALNQMAGPMNDAAMTQLLRIASAKFIMSLTGLVCSIALTITLRLLAGRLDGDLHLLCHTLEKRIAFASAEEIALRQLAAMNEARDHNRQLTMQIIADIGGALRTELPQVLSSSISSSINSAMQPLLEQVGRQGSDSMATMAGDLSRQLTSGVSDALGQASERLALAGDKIGQLAERMDQSSGRMGSEMEGAVARVALAVEALRDGMTATAAATSGMFTEGADRMLATMSGTLEAIRENTADGARAMTAAAAEMRAAATAMRSEMEAAAEAGAAAARDRMQAAGDEAGEAIGKAGRGVLDAFGKAGADIARMTEELSAKAGADLIEPIALIAEELEAAIEASKGITENLRRLSDSVRDGARAGAEAAGSFGAASQDLVAAAGPVRATTERIEAALRQLADGTQSTVAVVTQSARSVAETARQTLDTARETLAAERQGIDHSLAAVGAMLDRLKGQGERIDTIDQKLGTAFELYASSTEQAMQSVRSHVGEMSKGLNASLDTLSNAIQQLEDFTPQQARR